MGSITVRRDAGFICACHACLRYIECGVHLPVALARIQTSELTGTTTRQLLAPTPKTVGPVCPKCGIIKKSGKRSCCARGGAWFTNCGDVGDSNFGHTWVEGIQACTGFTSLSSVDTPALLMMRYARSNSHRLNTTQSPNLTHQQTDIYPTASVSYASTTDDSKGYVELAKVVDFTSLLLIILQSHM